MLEDVEDTLPDARQKAQDAAREACRKALVDMKKLLSSRKALLVGRASGLQAYQARAIQACLHLMDAEGQGMMAASEVAARANLFSRKWGARLVRKWTQAWVRTRTLPESQRGRHAKVMSVLAHPTVRAAVRAYLRSEKWSQNPVRLKQMMNNKLSMEEAREYRRRLGLSRSTMRRLLLSEGFTCWLLNGESPIKKKGPGRGLHQSDFICSTVGWLHEASVTLEYGKNHEGFWNGELFCKQLTERFFPAFKKAHGDGHIACILMNLNPGGAQPHMRDGWYLRDGEKVTQQMIFPSDHPERPNQPKGMKAICRGD
ncbi:hypothetical protein BD310DRAFT_953119 [Dichomitus squalens]|uniref:Uncharacterized protein n=1 Tax=Dichomitus squalens TaxID=114155 RepID=A0A4V2K6C9_9APHY|nr:hypothetical protein BD310DRAFT_953119 [Dichomitus squalens]